MTALTIDPQLAADLYGSGDGSTVGHWTRVGEQHDRTSRWLDYYHLVIVNEAGEHYGVQYGIGLTEYQENDLPWEDGDSALPLVRLYPHEVTTTEYRTAPAV